MTHRPAAQHYSELQAGSLQTGHLLLLPDGERSAEIQSVLIEDDDFGTPAVVLATLTGGGILRIAAGSTVLVAGPGTGGEPVSAGTTAVNAGGEETTVSGESDASPLQLAEPPAARADSAGEDSAPAAPAVVVPPLPATTPTAAAAAGPSEEELALIPEPSGTPESVVEAAASAHPDASGVMLLSDRLAKGINTKSGSCLKDLNDLAHELFVVLKDAEGALAVADLLNVLPFDGNPGRWTSVEAALALSSYICRQTGQEDRAEVYEKLLRAPDAMETDPFKSRMNAKVRQRSLNEPNLYDKEIFRAIDNSNPDAEREWRLLRLEALMFLRAHGGSETIGLKELERRIGNELESVRG
ncbi:hypothetical protein TV39_02750 [Arthrobacter sp. SPG23]|uniref:DUF6707 family protein n=1 Tax=Arthrobacter sp. SPG23 TaxID=1610703 RepID=UPI0005BA8EA2|nr:DUF6707 family protein [Arthrobacter sp. SPG23]KIS28844.1 hypothetical protein TV39_02750 [Arthrobacter sp. SPG23]